MLGKVRKIVDILMVICFMALMFNQITGVFAHEVIGIITFILFIIHHVINRGFYKNMFKGKFTKLRIAFLIIDVLLFIMMILMMVSSVLLSQHVFAFLNITNHMLGRRIHIVSAYMIYMLSAIHFGFHFNQMVKLSKDKKIIVNVFLGLFALAFGVNGFIKKEFISKIFLQNLFPLYVDDSFGVILIDYLGIFIMFMMIGYGIYNLMMFKKGEKR